MKTSSAVPLQSVLADPRLPREDILSVLKPPSKIEALLAQQEQLQHGLAELLKQQSCLLKPLAPGLFTSLEEGKNSTLFPHLFIHVELSPKEDHKGRLKFSEINTLEIRGCSTHQACMAYLMDRTASVRSYSTNCDDQTTVRKSNSSFTLVSKQNCQDIGKYITEHPALRKSAILRTLTAE